MLTSERATYSVNFSPFSSFYVLNYDGPGIPWQRLISVDDKSLDRLLTSNNGLREIDAAYLSADVSYRTVSSEGNELNVVELLPPNMDTSGRIKYPILFQV